MKLIMFKGISNTGKTTTVTKVIKGLCGRGFSVGSVKNIHFEGFTMETEGTDTDQHKKAGAHPVTARGLSETDIMLPGSADIEEILENYTNDWVVLEGNSGANCPNIVTGKSTEELDEQINELTIGIAGVISKEMKEYKGLPVFNGMDEPEKLLDFIVDRTPERMPNYDKDCCIACGDSGCRGLMADMLQGKRDRSECIVDDGNVKLFFDGEEVMIVDFVKDIMKGSVKGMISKLKGYKDGTEVTLKFK